VDASWAAGDFNGDGLCNSDDLIDALADGGYENGPRLLAVPEPAGMLSLIAFVGWLCVRSVRTQR